MHKSAITGTVLGICFLCTPIAWILQLEPRLISTICYTIVITIGVLLLLIETSVRLTTTSQIEDLRKQDIVNMYPFGIGILLGTGYTYLVINFTHYTLSIIVVISILLAIISAKFKLKAIISFSIWQIVFIGLYYTYFFYEKGQYLYMLSVFITGISMFIIMSKVENRIIKNRKKKKEEIKEEGNFRN